MSITKVGLVQINNSFSNQNYLPYSVGLLQAYVQKYIREPERYEFLSPIYRRVPVAQAVQELLNANVIGFSTYVWNIKISLEIAKKVKSENPDVLVMFGGPQVPDQPEQFLRQHPFIDLVCHGEGERILLDILEHYPSRDWKTISSISFLEKNGHLVQHPKGARIADLSVIPSPFLEGVFEPLIQSNPTNEWIVLWETNRGCPFQCTFCDWGSSNQSKVYKFDLDRVFQEIEWFATHQIEFVFCCDANFGILKRDLEIVNYLANTKKKYGYPKAFSIQSTKNATDRSYLVQKVLADAGMNKGVSLSLQSLTYKVLENIKRQNISVESYQELQHRFTKDHIETFTDLILGLPGETYDTFLDSISQIIENGQHNRIQFNNLAILPNAEMGRTEYQREHGLVMVECKIINIHGTRVESTEEIYETQQLVIATNSMPKREWCKTRTLCWLVALFHFDKLLQIPLIVLHEIYSFSYLELFEEFMEVDAKMNFPVLSEIRNFFWEKASDIQNGGEEYCHSTDWLNIWWPADEYIFIKLSTEKKLGDFYREAEKFFHWLLEKKLSISVLPTVLRDALLLNRGLINQPFHTDDLEIKLSHNIWDFYQEILKGNKIAIEDQPTLCHIERVHETRPSWEDWYREVVWYGNKKGAYMYKRVHCRPKSIYPEITTKNPHHRLESENRTCFFRIKKCW